MAENRNKSQRLADRKTYRTPLLSTFGHFRDVTLAGTNTGTKNDNTTGRATKLNTGA